MQVGNWQVRGDSKADRQGCPSYAHRQDATNERKNRRPAWRKVCHLCAEMLHATSRLDSLGAACGPATARRKRPKAAKTGQNALKRPKRAMRKTAKVAKNGQKRPKRAKTGQKPVKSGQKRPSQTPQRPHLQTNYFTATVLSPFTTSELRLDLLRERGLGSISAISDEAGRDAYNRPLRTDSSHSATALASGTAKLLARLLRRA